MRREALYLADIVEAAEAIERFLATCRRDDFPENDLLRSAVLQKLAIIGEAAARLPKAFQVAHPDVEWADIIGLRNIVVHAYFAVDWDTVWVTATQDVPDLKQKILAIVQRESPE